MRTIEETTLTAYRETLYHNEKSQNTIDKYIRDIRTFNTWLETQEHQDITKDCVICYKKHLKENYRTTSANSMLIALNVFFRHMGWDDCRVTTLKMQRSLICDDEKELTKEEYESLIRTAEEEKNDRLALIIEAMGSTGIRVSEMQFLTVGAAASGKITICNKGKYRTVYLVKKLKLKLLRYCKKNNITAGIIFVTKNGNPIDRSNLRTDMQKIAEKAGVALTKVFPHNLRHFFARTYYSIHKNIANLADILGHSSINTTRIYVATTEAEHRKMLERLQLVS